MEATLFLKLIVRAQSSDGKKTVPPTRSSIFTGWSSHSLKKGSEGMPTASLHADDSMPASHSQRPLRNKLDFVPGSPRKSLILSVFLYAVCAMQRHIFTTPEM